MTIQCPFCFEHVPIRMEALRAGPARRCPQGKSVRENPAGGLRHCYCAGGAAAKRACCKCGEALKA